MLFKLKCLLAFLFLFSAVANAQSDTTLFYYRYPDKIMDTPDNPDFIRMILPPDTSISKSLYVVKDYYPNGKIKMVASSRSNSLPLLDGPYMEFHPNGKRKATGTYALIGRFEKQGRTGICTEYYNNGKLLSISDMLNGTNYKLVECRDTAGNVIAEKGNGKWLAYDHGSKTIIKEGTIVNGLEDGEWHEQKGDTIKYTTLYKKGKLVSGKTILPSGKTYSFTEFDAMPELRKNNTQAFFKNNFRYKDLTQLAVASIKVRVAFKVDENGKLSDVHAIESDNPRADAEGVRVMKASAAEWTPAYKNGIPQASDCQAEFTVSTTRAYVRDGEPQAYNYYISVFIRVVNYFKI